MIDSVLLPLTINAPGGNVHEYSDAFSTSGILKGTFSSFSQSRMVDPGLIIPFGPLTGPETGPGGGGTVLP